MLPITIELKYDYDFITLIKDRKSKWSISTHVNIYVKKKLNMTEHAKIFWKIVYH